MWYRNRGQKENDRALNIKNLLNIIRRDSLSLITNITGLSLGLAASILLTTFIIFELSFDRHFSAADQIFRLNSIWIEQGEQEEMPINTREAYSEIPGKVPGIQSSVQIYRGFIREITYEENRFKDLSLLYADPEFFEIFDLEMLAGRPEEALRSPGSVVLTDKIASRVFGDTDPLGKSFIMEKEVYTVSALLKDIPPNTHFKFDMLMPMEAIPDLQGLGGLEFFTYYLLEKGAEASGVLKSITEEYTTILNDKFSDFGSATFDSRLTPLPRVHLHSGVSWDLSTPGNIRTIYIMLAVTLAVMILALSNFINLYILNGARRSKEIGIRKVNGAGRKRLIRQFYLETTLVVTMAFIAGTVLALFLLPPFANIMQRGSFVEISSSPALYLVLAGIYLLCILLSGFYPALLLSKAAPIPLIRGTINPAGDKKVLLRLVSVFQICIAISLLAILLGINTQIRFLKNRSPGYHPDNIVLIYNLNEKLTSNYPSIRDQILDIPGIENVAASTHTIGRGYSGQGINMQGDDPSLARSISEYRIWPGLCQLYQFNLLAGRFLEEDRSSDRAGVILNEEAVEMLGKTPQNIIGESVVMHADPLEVIGVVEDFHFQSAARSIEPLVLTAYSEYLRCISIRYLPGSDPQHIVQSIGNTIKTFDPDYVMINSYATDICNSYYTSEERLQKILMFGSLFSILIVMLGIYALVSHNILRRTREIGIRKVMGGSTREMMILIYTSTLKWTMIASALAVPLALLYLDRWLNNFAVQIKLHWWIFAGSIMIVLVFQTLITLGRSRRTARRNPVEALSYE